MIGANFVKNLTKSYSTLCFKQKKQPQNNSETAFYFIAVNQLIYCFTILYDSTLPRECTRTKYTPIGNPSKDISVSL